MRHAQVKMDIEYARPGRWSGTRIARAWQYRHKSSSKARFAYCLLRKSFQFNCGLVPGGGLNWSRELRPVPPEALPHYGLADELEPVGPMRSKDELEEIIRTKDLVIEKQIEIIKILNNQLTRLALRRI